MVGDTGESHLDGGKVILRSWTVDLPFRATVETQSRNILVSCWSNQSSLRETERGRERPLICLYFSGKLCDTHHSHFPSDFLINLTFQTIQTWNSSAPRTSQWGPHVSPLPLYRLLSQMFRPSLHHPLKGPRLQKERDLRSTSVWATVPTIVLSRCNTQANSCLARTHPSCQIVFFSHRFESDHRTSDSPVGPQTLSINIIRTQCPLNVLVLNKKQDESHH